MSRLIITALVTALIALVSATPAATQQPPSSGNRAVEVRVIEHDEFRWGDAAIGALAGFGLAAMSGGVIVATGRKRSDP